jgi:hypothetical protein
MARIASKQYFILRRSLHLLAPKYPRARFLVFDLLRVSLNELAVERDRC